MPSFREKNITQADSKPSTVPDGGKVVVYQNQWPNSPIVETQFYRDGVDRGDVELPATNVNLGNVIRLTGLAFGIENSWLKVIYRWRSIGKLDQELLCFTHILDYQRKVVGFLDYAILSDARHKVGQPTRVSVTVCLEG